MNRVRVGVLSVVPSPYQRDLFSALARDDMALNVYYMERTAPDSPWPEPRLNSHEKVLPGFWIPLGATRCHLNRGFPPLENFDLIICNTLMSWTAQRLIRAMPPQKPWIFWGERLRTHLSPFRRQIQEWLSAPLRQAAAIAGIGSEASADYQRRFPQPRHYSIPYYCDLKPFALPKKTNPTRTTFLFCGQMIQRKGIDLLLQSFSRLHQDGRRIKLILVGREAELPSFLAPIPAAVRADIEYAGFQPPEELPGYFSQADVFVLPSRYEGWGVVVNQAVGAGLPVICSEAVGAGFDLVEEGVNGCRVPTGSAEALALKMRELADHPAMIDSWGKASAAKSLSWSPEAGAAKWAQAVHEVMKTT